MQKYNPAKWDLDAERELWAAICAPNRWFNAAGEVATHPESLWWFVHIAWGAEMHFQNGNRRWIVRKSRSGMHVHDYYFSWLQKNILEWKAKRLAGEGKRMFLAIILPRNFGKSITATRCATLWSHLDEPDMSTLIGSATSKLAEDFLNSISITISGKNELSWFSWLYGNWENPEREWTKTAFHHGYRRNAALQEPSFDITAVDIGMTGYHHFQHVWDDPIFINKYREGGTYMDTVHTAFNASYKALQPDGLLMLVCTRYMDDDVAGRHLKEEGVMSWDGMDCPNTMMFQKYALGEGAWKVFFWQVEDEVTGKATCPEIMDEERIASEKAMDPEDFACQYQNNPGTGGHAPLTETQLRDCFVDYKDLKHEFPIECASLHLDTAFKDSKTIRKGDFNAIVTFLHDARPNGLVYLHTDLLRHDVNREWRSEDFSAEVIKILQILRRQLYTIKCITDEKEMGGKSGIYRQNFISALRGANIKNFGRFLQLQRQGTNKRSRIRKAAGMWAEGYVKILLHKDERGMWIIPPAARELFNQIMRIDVVPHDDLADASADIFDEQVWRKPTFDTGLGTEEGMSPRTPGDEGLKALSRRLTNDEVRTLLDEETSMQGWGNGLGSDVDWIPDNKF